MMIIIIIKSDTKPSQQVRYQALKIINDQNEQAIKNEEPGQKYEQTLNSSLL